MTQPSTPPTDGGLQVSPDDLKTFAATLRNFIPTVDQVKADMEGVKILAGDFPDGSKLKELIEGFGTSAGGRAAAYAQHMGDLHTAFELLADKLEKLANDYANIEDLNKALAGQLPDIANEIGAYLPQPTG